MNIFVHLKHRDSSSVDNTRVIFTLELRILLEKKILKTVKFY